jgi:hypothetical protein
MESFVVLLIAQLATRAQAVARENIEGHMSPGLAVVDR